MAGERAVRGATTVAGPPRLTVKLPELISLTSGCNLAKAVDGVTIDHLADLTKEILNTQTTESEVCQTWTV